MTTKNIVLPQKTETLYFIQVTDNGTKHSQRATKTKFSLSDALVGKIGIIRKI